MVRVRVGEASSQRAGVSCQVDKEPVKDAKHAQKEEAKQRKAQECAEAKQLKAQGRLSQKSAQ